MNNLVSLPKKSSKKRWPINPLSCRPRMSTKVTNLKSIMKTKTFLLIFIFILQAQPVCLTANTDPIKYRYDEEFTYTKRELAILNGSADPTTPKELSRRDSRRLWNKVDKTASYVNLVSPKVRKEVLEGKILEAPVDRDADVYEDPLKNEASPLFTRLINTENFVYALNEASRTVEDLKGRLIIYLDGVKKVSSAKNYHQAIEHMESLKKQVIDTYEKIMALNRLTPQEKKKTFAQELQVVFDPYALETMLLKDAEKLALQGKPFKEANLEDGVMLFGYANLCRSILRVVFENAERMDLRGEMSFKPIDQILNKWCYDNHLKLIKNYKDHNENLEVRAVSIYARNGDKYQLWVEYIGNRKYLIKGWDLDRQHVRAVTNVQNLNKLLDKVYKQLFEWMNDDNKSKYSIGTRYIHISII